MKGMITRINHIVIGCLLLLLIVVFFFCLKDSVPLSHLHFTLSRQDTDTIQKHAAATQIQKMYKEHVTPHLILKQYMKNVTAPKQYMKFEQVSRIPKQYVEHMTDPPTLRPPIPGNKALALLSDKDLEELYYTYAENGEVICVKKVRVGKVATDGWDLCHDPEYRPRLPCIVYSFGVHHNFSFEDDVSDRYGCTVHTFDHGLSLKSHRRSKRVFFHVLDLVHSNQSSNKVWKHVTLGAIKTKLKHSKIDVVKIDIERQEMQALPQILASGDLKTVSQLFFEIHTYMYIVKKQYRSLFLKGLKMFRGLHQQGFRIFYSTRNNCFYTSKWSNLSRAGCHRISMVNVNSKQN